MMLRLTQVLSCAAILAATSAPAFAGLVGWNQSNCSTPSGAPKTSQCTVGFPAQTVKLSAWSAPTAGTFATATLERWSEGFGVKANGEGGSPQHAVDNNGGTDAILMQFSSDVILTRLGAPWGSYDKEVSVMRYTGTVAPVFSGLKVNELRTTAGWDWFGDFRIATDTQLLGGAKPDLAASWWLVSAYDSGYSGASRTGFETGNDYFKLKSFQADVMPPAVPGAKVPEPASWSLLGIAMLGIAASRRKRKA
jgi:hypothetical protein